MTILPTVAQSGDHRWRHGRQQQTLWAHDFGISVRDKALKDGNVEIKPRTAQKPELVPVDAAAGRVIELLADL